MKELRFLNEKGNAKATVRKQVSEQSMEKVEDVLEKSIDNTIVRTARGTLAIEVGVEATTGEPIYFEVSGKVTMKDPSEKPKGKKETSDEPEETISLFED